MLYILLWMVNATGLNLKRYHQVCLWRCIGMYFVSLLGAWHTVDCVWNVIAHAPKPDFVFRENGRVHLNRRGRQLSRLLAAEVCALAVVMTVMLNTPFSRGSMKSTGYPLHSSVSPSLPLPCVTVCHHISTGLYLRFDLYLHSRTMHDDACGNSRRWSIPQLQVPYRVHITGTSLRTKQKAMVLITQCDLYNDNGLLNKFNAMLCCMWVHFSMKGVICYSELAWFCFEVINHFLKKGHK